MRLTANNIRFIKEYTYDGITYSWGVAMKSNRVSDGRSFSNYDSKGRTTLAEYKKENLPASVQRFINTHQYKEFSRMETATGGEFIQYIYS